MGFFPNTANSGVAGNLTVSGTTTLNSTAAFNGITSYGAGSGTNSAAAANVLTPAFTSGTSAQLSDHTRDYMLYMECTTSGTALVMAIGPTSTPANTVVSSVATTAGDVYSFRLPAGWFFEWTATTAAFATQTAVSC